MRRVFVLGNRYWSRHITKLLIEQGVPAEYVDRKPQHLWRIFSDLDARLLLVGLGGPPGKERFGIWAFVLSWWALHRRRDSIIVYWIGTDVLGSLTARGQALMDKMIRLTGAKHIAGAPWFSESLARRGLAVETVLFPYDTARAVAYPQPFLAAEPYRICTYLAPAGWANAHGDETLAVARMTPSVQWTVMGMSADQAPGESIPQNMTFLGWVDDPLKVISESHALIRWVDHDAYSGVVREAQAMGKTVLYSLQVKGIVSIAGMEPEQVADQINRVATGTRIETDQGYEITPYEAQIRQLAEIVSSDGSRAS